MSRRGRKKSSAKRKSLPPPREESGLYKGAVIFTVCAALLVAGQQLGLLPVSPPNEAQFQSPTPNRRPPTSLPSPASLPSRPAEEQPEPRSPSKPAVAESLPKSSTSAPPRREERLEVWSHLVLPDTFWAVGSGDESVGRVEALEISRGRPDRPWVALTFDAHYDAEPLLPLLDLLAQEGLQATFFTTGRWAERNPNLIRRLAEEGHELGNHSYSHPKFTELTDEEIVAQVTRTDALLRDLTGGRVSPYVRPPFGNRDARVLRVLLREGFVPVYWTVDTWDWKSEVSARQVRARALEAADNGAIVLMHATTFKTVEALPGLLAGLREKGLTPGTVTDVLRE